MLVVANSLVVRPETLRVPAERLSPDPSTSSIVAEFNTILHPKVEVAEVKKVPPIDNVVLGLFVLIPTTSVLKSP